MAMLEKICGAKSNNTGFTLVELAISLMVIGLLIGGVLKGQELIKNAGVTKTVKDLSDYDAAIMLFRLNYDDDIPGDMPNAGTRLPNCTGLCSAASAGGTGNWKLDYFPEVTAFWIHLERAGLISGINEQSDYYQMSPKNALGGHMVMMQFSSVGGVPPAVPTAEHPYIHQYRVGEMAGGGVASDTLKCGTIEQIDHKIDDGKPFTGRVKLFISHGNAQNCYDTSTLEYIRSNDKTYILVASDAMNY